MATTQFRVLYREFLFRLVDLELLSTHALGDIHKLLGRCAALLLTFSSMEGINGIFFPARWMRPDVLAAALMSQEHSFTAITMLAAGIFAVLSWDSVLPSRRDVLVLAPLPLRVRTLFLAKAAALGAAFGVTIAALNVFQSFIWAFHFAPAGAGPLGLIRSVAAYWITMFASGAFIFCSVIAIQGLAAQLPRRYFVRLSAALQIGALSLFICTFFLEPSLARPQALSDPHNLQTVMWLPSYWFLALFRSLNGSTSPALGTLALRACIGLAVAVAGGAGAFLLSYYRTLPRIVEEPDILPGARGRTWLPRFGNPLETAVTRFSIRTLLRSRHHRVLLAFYLGIGFALVTLLTKSAHGPADQRGLPLMLSSFLMMGALILGTRVVYSMPIELRANWIFRITQVHPAAKYFAAIRRPIFIMALAPAWIGSAALFLILWPWRQAAVHLAVLGLSGAALAYVRLYGFRKIPFTCSYLPGKSNLQMAVLTAPLLLVIVIQGVVFEWNALNQPALWIEMTSILALAVVGARWVTVTNAQSEEAVVEFEEEEPPAVQLLGIGPTR